MKTWILNWWDSFRSSFWFVPVLLSVTAVFLAIAMPQADRVLAGDIESRFEIIVSTAEAARLSLSSIAGAMITVTGVVFSITIVTLTLTASQFGSRLLRNLMEDIITHLTLGSMMATSLYSLLVLRVIVDNGPDVFVPHLSVLLAIIFVVFSMAMFIYFLHHVAQRMQAPNLVHAVSLDLDSAMNRLYPEKIGDRPEDDSSLAGRLEELGDGYALVSAEKKGYLQAINGHGLLSVASETDIVIYVANHPGVFLYPKHPLAKVWPKEKMDEALARRIRECFISGRRRTPRQDLEYALKELVEIAVRALSPGINDPFTAMTCMSYLGAGLVRLTTRDIPSPARLDDTGKLRLLTKPVDFGMALRSSFRLIIHYGRRNADLFERLLELFADMAAHVQRNEDRTALREEIEHVREVCDSSIPEKSDRDRITGECNRLAESLGEGTSQKVGG